eukprot:gnl/Hemi2/14064_TR4775_c0_g1_i1.p1 gnl/Hemi2/14064_TR4775_c0_g1~~gnl/Hemi2/14064_TR4775_c0_g1_i1.p1  ORF type:complete len:166 (-),score=56.26 gnl/Hemi2/14064_TR4775_c0_g1_i1:108-605(-)
MASPKSATFGGGCFWGVEKFFRKEFGSAITTKVGYMGGAAADPSYEAVCTGQTGHAEVVSMLYDEAKVEYRQLVEYFYRVHDPTTPNQQGNDRGTQYRSVIFFHSPEQETVAKEVTERMQRHHVFEGKQIVTQIAPAGKFWTAEEYHQDYLEKNPGGYCNHRVRF